MADPGAAASRYAHARFPMIELPRIRPKPRCHSMLLISEVGMPLRMAEDLLEIAEPADVDAAGRSIYRKANHRANL